MIKTPFCKRPSTLMAIAILALSGAALANPVILPDPVPPSSFSKTSTWKIGEDRAQAASGLRVVAPPSAAEAAAGAQNESQSMVWRLRAGQPIHTQIQEWAQLAGWEVKWAKDKSWVAPADAEFSGDFLEALSALVSGLYSEGKSVRMRAWKGNRYAEIINVSN